jgi:hypothetical protein
MSRLRMIGLCLVAVVAIGAVAAASASAEAPEYGRCIKKAKTEGAGFSDANCNSAVGAEGKYEWIAGPGPKAKFTSVERFLFSGKYTQCLRARGEEEIAEEKRKQAETAPEPEKAKLIREAEEHERVAEEKRAKAKLNKAECEALIEEEHAKAPAVLQTVTGSTVTCGGVTSTGEYSGTKTVGNLVTTFTECSIGGLACQSAGAEEGEIVTATLDGVLGVVQKEEPLTKTKVKIGLDLFPAEGTVVNEFNCSGFGVVVTGSVIHEVKANKMVLTETEKFTQSKGKQKPESFEGQPADVLETSIFGGPNEQSGLTLKGELTNEEKIEINTVV